MIDVRKSACAVEADRTREVALVDADAVNKTVAQAMVSAVVSVKEDVAEVGTYLCGEPEALDGLPPERMAAALRVLSAAGLQNAVSTLLARPDITIDVAGSDGRTALFVACQNGETAVARMLLAAGADADLSDGDGITPLWMATQNSHEAVVDALLKEGKADANRADNDGITPLMMVRHAPFDTRAPCVGLVTPSHAVAAPNRGYKLTPTATHPHLP